MRGSPTLGDAVRFERADAAALPLPDASVDAVVSGLVLNFVSAPEDAVAEMVRVPAPGRHSSRCTCGTSRAACR